MLKTGGNGTWSRVCDTCRSASAVVYCRSDSLYLCAGCDSRIHHHYHSTHERVWVCESCERAPAAFLCKADAASLCADCDADVHSANPLARRHNRIPIPPIAGSPDRSGKGAALAFLTNDETLDDDEDEDEDEEEEAASWLLFNNPVKNGDMGGLLFGSESMNEYLDLVGYNSCQENQYGEQQQYVVGDQKNCGGGDGVVPVRGDESNKHRMIQQQEQMSFQLSVGYETSKPCHGYSPTATHTSSIEAGIVPDSTMSEVTNTTHPIRPPKGTIDLFSGTPVQQVPTQLTAMDREARVMRYREKKKTRKFQKTIRYASRKAYAETRPRIKGRFAKRTDIEVEQMFSTSIITDSSGYGIVPSF